MRGKGLFGRRERGDDGRGDGRESAGGDDGRGGGSEAAGRHGDAWVEREGGGELSGRQERER